MNEGSAGRPRVIVRDAGAADHAAIAAVTRAAYAEYAAIMEPAAWEGLRRAVEGALETQSAGERIVAEIEGDVVGGVMLVPPDTRTYRGPVAVVPWPEIRLLAVAPWARGSGVGRALLRECLDRAAKYGSRVGLHTSRSMRAAIEMYRGMGFVRASEFDFQPPGGELVEAYVLTLPGADRGDGSGSTAVRQTT